MFRLFFDTERLGHEVVIGPVCLGIVLHDQVRLLDRDHCLLSCFFTAPSDQGHLGVYLAASGTCRLYFVHLLDGLSPSDGHVDKFRGLFLAQMAGLGVDLRVKVV